MNKINKSLDFLLDNLLYWGLLYQFSVDGPFDISIKAFECGINNRFLNQFGFDFVSVERGDCVLKKISDKSKIQDLYEDRCEILRLHFVFTGELRNILRQSLNLVRVTASVNYSNCESTSVEIDSPAKCSSLRLNLDMQNIVLTKKYDKVTLAVQEFHNGTKAVRDLVSSKLFEEDNG